MSVRILRTTVALLSVIILALAYQNCGNGFRVARFETVLSQCHGNDCKTELQKPSYTLSVADRNYVFDLLSRLYAGTPQDENILNTLRGTVLSLPEHLDGICTYSDGASCRPYGGRFFVDNFHNAQVSSASSPTKEGARLKTCLMINNLNTAVTNALTKLGLTESSDFSEQNLTLAYRAFYQERSASQEVIGRLADLGRSASAGSQKLEGWRMVLLALCTSSGWQLN